MHFLDVPLWLVCFIPLAAVVFALAVSTKGGSGGHLSWDMADEIRAHIKEPVFPNHSVSILDFGAVPDDGKLDTEAIQSAINHVSARGGGTVIVPKGTFDTGALELKSNVNLHLPDPESKLLFTREINEKNYPIVYTHWEATPLYNYSPLIYALDAVNIGLTGRGALDAQSNFEDTWWDWHRKKVPVPGTANMEELQAAGQRRSRDMNMAGTPIEERRFGDGWYLRPNFVQPIRCKNVLFEGVTLLNSPMWQLNPVFCENLIARGLTLRAHGYNTDCADPESCNYVLIENNVFDSGDDCIAIKSGRDRDGRAFNIPCQNLLILNNRMADGHGGIAIGSEISGSVRNVFADGNHFDSPRLTYPLRLKTNARRGGVIENVYLRNSVVENVDQAVIHGTMLYSEGSNGDSIPVFRNIVVENVKSRNGLYGIFIEAFPDSPVTGLVLRNVEICGVEHPLRAMNWGPDVVMDNVAINGVAYPAPTEARILGVPAPGETLRAAALLIGGEAAELAFTWEAADAGSGDFEAVASGRVFTVPADYAGKRLRIVARDGNAACATSIPYTVLKSKAAGGFTPGSRLGYWAARLAARGIIAEDAAINPEADISRIELARMLFNLWRPVRSKKQSRISDIANNSPDYEIASAVVENNMMTLDRSINTNLSDVIPDDTGEMRAFAPDGKVTREEMGTIVMMSCGVSYKNASNTYESTYRDGVDISNLSLTDVERGTTLGFWDNTGFFEPKRNMTYAMTLDSMNRIADFAGK